MKVVPPKKPHFFKPIQPGFKHSLKIPRGFLKYLKGHDNEHVVLRRAGKKWLVKLNGHRFEEGWENFAEEHDLQLGNILVFRLEGDMEFEVVIFDSSHCDREYAEYLHVEEETSKKFISKGTRNFSRRKPSTCGEDDLPYFISTIKPYCISKPVLHLPMSFAKSNGLKIGKCEMILKDEAHRSWPVWLGKNANHYGITRGWTKFRAANDLQVGDAYKFELVKKGRKPIAFFHCLRGSPSLQPEVKKNNLDDKSISDEGLNFQEQTDLRTKTSDETTPKSQVAASTSAEDDANPHFVSTIKPYTISHPVLYLPMAFARSNDLLRRSEMILVNEKHKKWSVRLGPSGGHFGITRGWTEFMKANGVRVGDTYKFELINNGTTPIAYFHCKYTE